MKNKFPNEKYLINLKEKLETYVPNKLSDKVKAKIVSQIVREFDSIYDIQFEVRSIVSKLQDSHVLARNDLIIPFLIKEYAQLSKQLKELEKEYIILNKFNDLISIIKDIKKVFETKDLPNKLFKDLEYIETKYKFEIDKKGCINEFKGLINE